MYCELCICFIRLLIKTIFNSHLMYFLNCLIHAFWGTFFTSKLYFGEGLSTFIHSELRAQVLSSTLSLRSPNPLLWKFQNLISPKKVVKLDRRLRLMPAFIQDNDYMVALVTHLWFKRCFYRDGKSIKNSTGTTWSLEN